MSETINQRLARIMKEVKMNRWAWIIERAQDIERFGAVLKESAEHEDATVIENTIKLIKDVLQSVEETLPNAIEDTQKRKWNETAEEFGLSMEESEEIECRYWKVVEFPFDWRYESTKQHRRTFSDYILLER